MINEIEHSNDLQILWMGDFNVQKINCHSDTWTTICDVPSLEVRFLECARDWFLYQHINNPTCGRGSDQLSCIYFTIIHTIWMNRKDHWRCYGADYAQSCSKIKTQCGITDHVTEDGSLTTSDLKRSKSYHFFLFSLFSSHQWHSCCTYSPIHHRFHIIDLNMAKKKLHSLKISKSPGPDSLHPRVLQARD